MQKMKLEINGEEIEVPATWEVCPDCSGKGTELCGGMKGYAYSAEEFNECFDEEDRAEYFKTGGKYDVPCSCCKGRTTVLAPDWELMNDPELERAWQEQIDYEHQSWLESEAERKMGC